jgi:hypothetical protein
LLSNVFSLCSTIALIFSATTCAACCVRDSSMRWNTITPPDWSREADSSSFQIIFDTMEVTVRSGKEKVRDRRDMESVL